jgi:membrane protein YdbS with pleckstrin-like domain
LDYRSATAVSCWLAVAVIAVAYMVVFANQIGDVLFGVFLPVGLLILVAVFVTVFLAPKQSQIRNEVTSLSN